MPIKTTKDALQNQERRRIVAVDAGACISHLLGKQ